MHHHGRQVHPYNSDSKSEDSDSRENLWDYETKFNEKDQKHLLSELLFQFSPSSSFD